MATGPSDLLDRIAQTLIWIALVFSLANGAFMLFDPMGWYYAVPTVRATGPANTHFIADIGIAYLGCGIILLYAVRNIRMRWLAALAGGLWLMAHGGLHLYELMAGICSPDRFLKDAPGTIGVPLLVLIAVTILFVRQRIAPIGLPKSVFLGFADRTIPEDSQYLHEIAGAPGDALEKFMHFMPASNHRHAAPPSLVAVARIGAVLVEDCGPCALISARGGRADGVSRDVLNAALAGGGDLAPDDALAFRFGEAIARRGTDVDELGDAIESRFGRIVRLELTLAAAMVRAYPAMKRGLGLAKACSVTKLSI